MFSEIRPAIVVTLVLTAITGILYPLAMTGIAQLVFPHQANGSLVVEGDRIVGSELIGQNFSGEAYFHPRPSVAGANGYDANSSGGSNLGPNDAGLLKRIDGILVSLQGTMQQLSQAAQHLPQIARNVEGSSASLPSLLTQTQQAVHDLDQLVVQLRTSWLLGGGGAPATVPTRLPTTEVRP